MAVNNLFDRLMDNVPQDSPERISAHYFYAAMVGVADAQFTRGQLESHFDIASTGTDKTQLDFIFSGYQNAADKGRYLNALHAVFMLKESGVSLSQAQVTEWLTAAESAY